jgi:GTP-binding protein
MIDLGPAAERPPAEQEHVLLEELRRYQPDLLDRPRVVVGTKADVATADADAGFEGPRISAVTGDGLQELLHRMAVLVEQSRAAQPKPGGPRFVVHRPMPEGVRVERDLAGALVVKGREAERAVALSDLTNDQAVAYMQDRLRRLGVDRALARAGAAEGDVVHIGGFTFEYRGE